MPEFDSRPRGDIGLGGDKEVQLRGGLSDILKNDRFIAGIFDKYVFLKEGCFGILDKVFDKEYKRI